MEKYKTEHLKMSEVFADPLFNCRGFIAPVDIMDLAADIKARGLDQPIVVQPFKHPTKPNIKYRVVAGHRRHAAFAYNKAEEIPAFIRPDLTELDARMLNLRENVHRKELNIKQEAHALNYFLNVTSENTGKNLFNELEIAEMTGQSRGWVQVRKDLLKLPDDIQDVAASGMLNQEQIKLLARLKRNEDRYELVRKIKETKLKGEKVKLTPSVKRASDVLKGRVRKKEEIREMNGIIYDVIGPCLVTRLGAWTTGDISTAQLYASLEDYCDSNDIGFEMPEFVKQAIQGVKPEPAEVS